MALDGGLAFDLHCRNGAVEDVVLHANRPLLGSRLLKGKPVEQGLMLLGVLYHICGVAQRYAGISAWREAVQIKPSSALQQGEQWLLMLESVREHLWQLLVVWPGLLGETPRREDGLSILAGLMGQGEKLLFANGRGLSPQARLQPQHDALQSLLAQLDRLATNQVFGVAPKQWLEQTSSQHLMVWAETGTTPAARMIQRIVKRAWQGIGSGVTPHHLPMLAQTELRAQMVNDDRDRWLAQPCWQGECCETTALSRQQQQRLVKAVANDFGSGLLTRFTARLVELATLITQMQEALVQLNDSEKIDADLTHSSGEGLATIEAARGQLSHWISVEQGTISDYAILAPTEWNFHPQGVAVQGLKQLTGDEKQLREQAALWINAIDPCVAYEINIVHHEGHEG